MSEAHVPLALKYRPQRFDDLVGQEAAATILRNMVVSNSVYPGLILNGNRGSGKTTSARIYAKALNCERITAGDPCCECPTCLNIQNETSYGVVEMDAASYGNVDAVRKLQERISYSCPEKYRVIIMDEAHMLSLPAWNAMLKTLEEPPDNTVFVFVTTHAGKIPDTILSRCFSIPFRPIDTLTIAERVWDIAQREGIPITEEVAAVLAEKADGAMRNALVMLEQLHRLQPEGQIDLDSEAIQTLGYCGEHVYEELMDHWRKGNRKKFLELVRHWVRLTGVDNFVSGWEDAFYRWTMRSVGAMTGELSSYMQTWSLEHLEIGIRAVWRARDRAKGDSKRLEAALLLYFYPSMSEADTDGSSPKNKAPQAPSIPREESPHPDARHQEAPVAVAAPAGPPKDLGGGFELG